MFSVIMRFVNGLGLAKIVADATRPKLPPRDSYQSGGSRGRSRVGAKSGAKESRFFAPWIRFVCVWAACYHQRGDNVHLTCTAVMVILRADERKSGRGHVRADIGFAAGPSSEVSRMSARLTARASEGFSDELVGIAPCPVSMRDALPRWA